jgi:hypothetical protein
MEARDDEFGMKADEAAEDLPDRVLREPYELLERRDRQHFRPQALW